MLFKLFGLLSLTATVAVATITTDMTCPGEIDFEMACYKCGSKLDCIINDVGMGLTELEMAEIVKTLHHDDNFCNGRRADTTITGQQNCDDTVQFAFASVGSCCIPPGVLGDSNACPIRGQGLSNFGTYNIKIAPTGAKDCCSGPDEHSSYKLVSYTNKCDSAGCSCSFCEAVGSSCATSAGKYCTAQPALAEKATCSSAVTPASKSLT
jgi:hypothetical protein